MIKNLEEMDYHELGKFFPIIISKYNPDWANLYLTEKNLIEKAIGLSNIKRIHHFGSTAIPGICAKPTIDILLEVCDDINPKDLIHNFRSMGYNYSPQPNNPPPHMMFMKGYTINGFRGQAYHLHVRYSGDWDELYFCDYLILHPEVAEEYGKLKIQLKEKYEQDREAYTRGKTDFIKAITGEARKELGKRYSGRNPNCTPPPTT